jgi:hypothetical protein
MYFVFFAYNFFSLVYTLSKLYWLSLEPITINLRHNCLIIWSTLCVMLGVGGGGGGSYLLFLIIPVSCLCHMAPHVRDRESRGGIGGGVLISLELCLITKCLLFSPG